VSYFGTFGPSPPLDHLWSLAIEEQFYLIWPLVLWIVIIRPNGRGARVTVTLLAAAGSALAMALQYTPGGNPSGVYYGTDTHASALLIGAALALACPLSTLASGPAERTRRLDVAGVAGLAVLAWAAGHFSGHDPAVYPAGLILAALGAAGLVAAAASNGVIAAMTSWRPLRWVGIRSYGIYLWHWPVIALTAAVAGAESSSPWLWLMETGVTIAVASASWRFVESPILANGLRATCRHWGRSLIDAVTRQTGRLRRSVPVAVAAIVIFATACYGMARPPVSAAPAGMLRQVAEGERVSSASQSAPSAVATPAPRSGSSHATCRGVQPRVSGSQVTAVGDSVMVAAATALTASMRGIYIDAQVGRQMQAGLALIQSLAASGALRQIVVVGLGTNGSITTSQIRDLQRTIGPGRDLVLVSTFGPQSWEHEVNAVLAAAARRGGHTELADWDRAIAARPGLLWPDGIHPQPAGARLYARVVLTAIRAELSRLKPPPC
jgi:peptidoglycan/LPS O-acetylase OafA/YrhL